MTIIKRDLPTTLEYLSKTMFKYSKKLDNKLLDLKVVDACFPTKYQDQQTKLLVTDNWLRPDVLDEKYYEQFGDSWFGIYQHNTPIEVMTPIKNYNCLISRMDPIRQSWLYQLIRTGIFDQGYISFNMNTLVHFYNHECATDATPLEIFDQQYEKYMKIFQSEHEFIRDKIPYRNFESTININQLIMQSKFSIVLETNCDRNEVISFSEKIFRHLRLPRPWILFAMKDGVTYLRNIGFDVLDDIVDHSYDNCESFIDRQTKLLEQASILSELVFDNNLQKRLVDAATHNNNLLNKFAATFDKDIHVTLEKAVLKCKNL
jgi:hypothetical protein